MTSFVDDMNLTNIELQKMPYRKLQQLSKILKLPGNVKKDTMIFLLQARRDGNEEAITEFCKIRKGLQAMKQLRKRDMKSSSSSVNESHSNMPKRSITEQEHYECFLNKIHNNLYANSYYRPMCSDQQYFQRPSSPRILQPPPQTSLPPTIQMSTPSNFRKPIHIPFPPQTIPLPPPLTNFAQQESMAFPEYYTSFHQQYHPLNNIDIGRFSCNHGVNRGEVKVLPVQPVFENNQTFDNNYYPDNRYYSYPEAVPTYASDMHRNAGNGSYGVSQYSNSNDEDALIDVVSASIDSYDGNENTEINQNIGHGEMIPSLEAQQTFTQLGEMNVPSQQPHMLSATYQQQTVVHTAPAQRDWSSCYDTNFENASRVPIVRVEQKKIIDLAKEIESDQCKIITNFTETVMCASKNIKTNVNWNCNYPGKSFLPSHVEDKEPFWPTPTASTSSSDTASIPEMREPVKVPQEPDFNCRYLEMGCQKKLYYFQVLEHETYCLQQSSKCIFKDCNWINYLKHLPDHLFHIHSDKIAFKNEMIVPIELDNVLQAGKFSYLQSFNQRIYYITLLHVPPEYLCISIQFVPDNQQVFSSGEIKIMMDEECFEENLDLMPTRWYGNVEPFHAYLLPSVTKSLSVKCNNLPTNFSVFTKVSSGSNQNATVTQ